jgi:hypothetical protein
VLLQYLIYRLLGFIWHRIGQKIACLVE